MVDVANELSCAPERSMVCGLPSASALPNRRSSTAPGLRFASRDLPPCRNQRQHTHNIRTELAVTAHHTAAQVDRPQRDADTGAQLKATVDERRTGPQRKERQHPVFGTRAKVKVGPVIEAF